ncbi:hypothetical protein IEO21_04119 [Rhodonia placenta]|uniref:Uncharacterized protein n=1 Tax=Rhodonia placenta TaxID=104341 RepID=A0A8H7U3A6_9APHY|nr:hypothetical protein IEO21_04119 [Postia placenta]
MVFQIHWLRGAVNRTKEAKEVRDNADSVSEYSKIIDNNTAASNVQRESAYCPLFNQLLARLLSE